MKIEKVIICGLGALGVTYASKMKNFCELKILADSKRIEKYKSFPPVFNDEQLHLEYITPENKFDADLIIISTKASGLDSAISYIKNFVGENTVIMSLLNGVSSEEQIAKVYGNEKVLYSYFIGHSAVRTNNSVKQDGQGKIVFGGQDKKQEYVKEFFDRCNITCEISDDIMYSLWLKFAVNVYINQSSAIMNMTMGEMKRNPNFRKFALNLINETKLIALASGIKNLENFEKEALDAIELLSDDGKSSMLQDILAGRKTEVDIFAGEIIRRGKKFGIQTPYNQVVYDIIKILEEK